MVAGEDERGREVRTGLLGARGVAQRRPRSRSAGRRSPVALCSRRRRRTRPPSAPGACSSRSSPTLRCGPPRRSTLDGVKRDGAQIPQIGVVSVKPVGGRALAAVASALRKRPGVAHVELERRHTLRFVPNDPSLTTPETAPRTPPNTALQWWVARTGLPAAWDLERGDTATVAVIDTGIDGGHPELAGKIAEAIDNDATPGHGAATGDENGHGTHVSSLACAAGDNGSGIVGAGLNCRLIVDQERPHRRLDRPLDRAGRRPRRRRDQHELRHRRQHGARPRDLRRDRLRRRQGRRARRRRRGRPGRGAGRPRQPPAADRHRRRHHRRPRAVGHGRQLLRRARAVRRPRLADLARGVRRVRSARRAGRAHRRVPRQRDRDRERRRRDLRAGAVRVPHAGRRATTATPICRAPRWRRRSSRGSPRSPAR